MTTEPNSPPKEEKSVSRFALPSVKSPQVPFLATINIDKQDQKQSPPITVLSWNVAMNQQNTGNDLKLFAEMIAKNPDIITLPPAMTLPETLLEKMAETQSWQNYIALPSDGPLTPLTPLTFYNKQRFQKGTLSETYNPKRITIGAAPVSNARKRLGELSKSQKIFKLEDKTNKTSYRVLNLLNGRHDFDQEDYDAAKDFLEDTAQSTKEHYVAIAVGNLNNTPSNTASAQSSSSAATASAAATSNNSEILSTYRRPKGKTSTYQNIEITHLRPKLPLQIQSVSHTNTVVTPVSPPTSPVEQVTETPQTQTHLVTSTLIPTGPTQEQRLVETGSNNDSHVSTPPAQTVKTSPIVPPQGAPTSTNSPASKLQLGTFGMFATICVGFMTGLIGGSTAYATAHPHTHSTISTRIHPAAAKVVVATLGIMVSAGALVLLAYNIFLNYRKNTVELPNASKDVARSSTSIPSPIHVTGE